MGFRNGQWVKVGLPNGSQAVGIFMPERGPGGSIVETVHLVADDGSTSQVVTAQGLAISAVTDVKELPESRRAHLPENYDPSIKAIREVAPKGKK